MTTEPNQDKLLHEVSIEDLNNPQIDNSFSDASFSINHDYGKEYSECVKRLNPLVEEKYFNVFSNSRKEKITNTISPYSQETITWATVYTRVVRKIINPFQITKGKLFLSLEELDRHIAVVLQNRDLFKNTDTSSSEPIKGKIEINERLEKESENYIPKLIAKFSFIKPDSGKEDDNYFPRKFKRHDTYKTKKKPSSKSQPFRKQSALDLRRKNKLTTVSALNRLNLAYENHNSQKNIGIGTKDSKDTLYRKTSESIPINRVMEMPKKQHETMKRAALKSLTQQIALESQMQQPKKRTTQISVLPTTAIQAQAQAQAQSQPHHTVAFNKNSTRNSIKKNKRGSTTGGGILAMSPVKERIQRRVTIVEDPMPRPNFKRLNEYRQIPFEDNYFSVNHYKPVEKLAYRDELERYNPNKKINYGFYVTKDNENTFKEMYDLISFQPIALDSNKFSQAELQKRGDRIAEYKSMSNDLVYNILKVDHIK